MELSFIVSPGRGCHCCAAETTLISKTESLPRCFICRAPIGLLVYCVYDHYILGLFTAITKEPQNLSHFFIPALTCPIAIGAYCNQGAIFLTTFGLTMIR